MWKLSPYVAINKLCPFRSCYMFLSLRVIHFTSHALGVHGICSSSMSSPCTCLINWPLHFSSFLSLDFPGERHKQVSVMKQRCIRFLLSLHRVTFHSSHFVPLEDRASQYFLLKKQKQKPHRIASFFLTSLFIFNLSSG